MGTAAATVVALVAGGIVAGLGIQGALAAELAPVVSVTSGDTVLAGQDIELTVQVGANPQAANDQYNLSVAVLLPSGATVIGSELPATATYVDGAVVPGKYVATIALCSSVGLELANNRCVVPAGKQYLVFENISDLPKSAAKSFGLTVRPDATVFPVGAQFPVAVSAYTSDNERTLPIFPGSSSKQTSTAATSARGGDTLNVPISALRIEKAALSGVTEGKMLRGVHSKTGVYELTVFHTGQEPATGVIVNDFLDAGLEFLGCGTEDNSTAANGTRTDALEYPNAAILGSGAVANCVDPALVETITADAATAQQYNLVAGKVYTKVTWNLGNLDPALNGGGPQAYAGTKGVPGEVKLAYRVGIPLFENTMDFGAQTPTPASGQQGSNLDNNRGASTAHGARVDDANSAQLAAQDATKLTNTAAVQGSTATGGSVIDVDALTVEAEDVRQVKTVTTTPIASAADLATASFGKSATFETGQIATYRLRIETSEYAGAALDATPVTRVIDELGNGLCPAMPAGAPIAPGGLTLAFGDPNDENTWTTPSVADWNATLTGAHGVSSDCAYPNPQAQAGALLQGASLSAIVFNPQTGSFFIRMELDPATALANTDAVHDVFYTVMQNADYRLANGKEGSTSSGDTVNNTAAIIARTTTRPDLADVQSASGAVAAGDRYAWDHSVATLQTAETSLTKTVLPRSVPTPTPGNVASATGWVASADEAFAAGDTVWFKVTVQTPSSVDVRNPRLVDFLPEGLTFANAPGDVVVDPSDYDSGAIGANCPAVTNDAGFLAQYVAAPTVNGNTVKFDLGKACYANSTARFLPQGSKLDIYLRTTVSGVADAGKVDIAANLAKYQQANVDGQIAFMRASAGFLLDGGVTLHKGVTKVTQIVDGATKTLPGAFGARTKATEAVQGDVVTYAIDVTAPVADTKNYIIWDMLPKGIQAEDVITGSLQVRTYASDGTPSTAVNATVAAVNPPYTGQPLPVAPYNTQSALKFTVLGEVPGSTRAVPATDTAPAIPGVTRGFTITYDVRVPDGTGGPGASAAAEITQQFRNTAGIISYDVMNDATSTTTVVPQRPGDAGGQQLTDRTPAAGEVSADDTNTVDTALVSLPGVTPVKTLVNTEIGSLTANAGGTVGINDIDPSNGVAQIVQGEFATFEYSVTIPARTTVKGAKLADDGNFVRSQAPKNVPYVVQSATWSTTALDNTGFTFVSTGAGAGTLTFPAEYTNRTLVPQTFTVTLQVWVNDGDGAPDLGHGTTLTNTARFSHTNPQDPSQRVTTADDATVTYIEPALDITKTASPNTNVEADSLVVYTLSVTNPTGRPAVYNATVSDLLPAGLSVEPGSFQLNGVDLTGGLPTTVHDPVSGITTIAWNLDTVVAGGSAPGAISGGETVQLSFAGRVNPAAAAGGSYVNTGNVDGFTLPSSLPSTPESRRGERADTSSVTITTVSADITKGVRIGTSGAYQASASAPIGQTASYEVRVVLKPNINYYSAQITDTLPAGVSLVTGTQPVLTVESGTLPGAWTWAQAGQKWTGTYSNGGNTTIASSPVERVLVITYQAVLSDGVTSATPTNTAAFTWLPTPTSAESTRLNVSDTATVNVQHPAVSVAKTVNNQGSVSLNPNEELTYRVTVRNASGTGVSAAHNVVVTDTVPAGIVVNQASLAASGGVYTPAAGATQATITWNLTSELVPGASQVLTYTATFAANTVITDNQGATNAVQVTEYDSFPTGGREYGPSNTATATATPIFPNVTLDKSATTNTPALIDQPFSWTLSAVNTGAGAVKELTFTDTLPLNWEYDSSVAPTITIGNAASVPAGAPTITTVGGRQVATWTFTGTGTTALLPGSAAPLEQRTATLVFAAKPTSAVVTTPGVGTPITHRNDLSAVAKDMRGDESNKGRTYVSNSDNATALIERVDLKVVKEAIGGSTGATDTQWIPGKAAGTGYAAPQWRITLTNQGPDAAKGPFSVTDSTVMPTGVTTSAFTARYYANATATPVTVPLTRAGAGTAADPWRFVVGDSTTEALKIDGTNRIELVANVTITSGATGTVTNQASATAPTFETDADKAKDNASSDSVTLSPVADLAVVKTGPASARAGESITWSIAVTNNGPSASHADATKRITVTDTIPAGISGVADPTVRDGDGNVVWLATASNGFPATAGDTITWTLQATSLPVGAAAIINLTGTVSAGWTDGTLLRNTAQVAPGLTPDPVTSNDSSSTDVTPSTQTSLGITKTRVVLREGIWVDAATLSPIPPFEPGENVSYRITVTNLGPAHAQNVSVLDTPPSGLTFSNVGYAANGTWTRAAEGTADRFTLTSSPLQVGAANATSFVVTYTTSPSITGPITNTAQAQASNVPEAQWPTDGDSSDTTRRADLMIEKSHANTGCEVTAVSDDCVEAGNTVTYTLVVTNNGPSDSTGPIVITDTPALDFSYVDDSATVTVGSQAAISVEPTIQNGVLSWSVLSGTETLADEATITITYTLQVADDATARADATNQATVTGVDDQDASNNSTTDAIDVVTIADMTITKDVAAGPWVAGTDVTYTVTVTNNGPSVAPATLSDALPAGLVDATITEPSGWTCDDAALTCEIEELAVGAAQVFTITATVSPSVLTGTELTNEATVSWTDSRGPGNDDDDAIITVTTIADLGIVKTAIDATCDPTADAANCAEATTVVAGELARFVFAVENAGPSNAVGPLVVTDTLPAGMTFVGLVGSSALHWSAVPGAVDDTTGEQLVTFTRTASAGLVADASAPTLAYDVRVAAGVEHDATLLNVADVTSQTPEATGPDALPNTDDATLDVLREVDLQITKTHDAAVVRIGDLLTFMLEVRNAGPSDATGVVVTDVVPAGLDVTNAVGDVVGDGWTITAIEAETATDPDSGDALPTGATIVTVAYDATLVAGAEQAATFALDTTVTVAAYAEVTNVASVTATEITEEHPDRTPDDNTAADTVTVPPMATLVVDKDAVGSFKVGYKGTFTITVRNDGPTEDTGPIVVTDVLPAGLSFVSADSGGVHKDGVVTWTFDEPLGVGEQISMRLTVQVGETAYPSVANTATVSSPTEQTPDAQLTDTVEVPVAQADPLPSTGVMAPTALGALMMILLGGGVLLIARMRARQS